MRIAYLSTAILPSRTANSINMMKMSSAFTSLGHTVTMIASDRGPRHETDDIYAFYGVEHRFDIRVLRWLPVKGRSYIYAMQAARAAKRVRPDLVYTRSIFCALCASWTRQRVVLELHVAPVGSQLTLLRRLVRSPQLVRVVCITGALARRVAQDVPAAADRIVVAHDGADKPASNASVTLGGMSGRLHAGYVGHLYAGKGMEVISELPRRCPDVHFHVVGGMPKDIEHWQRKLAGVSNITLHGFVQPSDVYSYMHAFDVLLAPYGSSVSAYGGGSNIVQWMSPLKLFEYMAAGRAIVCSDLPALREVLDHEQTGLLCEAGNPDDWARSLERLADDPSLRKRLGHNAYALFERQYTWRARAAQILDSLGAS